MSLSMIVNLYNQKGAGPKHISLNFIQEVLSSNLDAKFFILVPDNNDYNFLTSEERVKIIKLCCPKNVFFKIGFRVYLELFLIPFIVKRFGVNKILAFGNFNFSPISIRKIVLLHHPYLVDDDLLSQLEYKPRFIEKLKRIGFYLTTKMVDTVVVQSSYMKNILIKKYPKHKFSIQIIPNPISSILKIRSESLTTKVLIEKREASITTHLNLLYVSRYYPHKNHLFLIQLSKLLNQIGISHSIKVTVDPSLVESQTFLRSISSRDISIMNIGELKQEELAQYYENTHMFLFPSRAETFGNPLIEAMCYALPVIVPDLEYARSIVGSAGLYYSEDNAEECMEIIKTLLIDSEYYFYKSNQSFEQFKNYPTTTEWFEKYMTLIR